MNKRQNLADQCVRYMVPEEDRESKAESLSEEYWLKHLQPW